MKGYRLVETPPQFVCEKCAFSRNRYYCTTKWIGLLAPCIEEAINKGLYGGSFHFERIQLLNEKIKVI
jgi:hypothetical protein